MKTFVEINDENNGNYLKLLSAMSKLSRLFSDKSTPLLNYRVVENMFCKSFKADNLSRSDTAFDAKYHNIGVGIKTFTCPQASSNEKIAEFNSVSNELKNLKGKRLAIKLADYRNKRISLAKRNYDIQDSTYHIVARKYNELVLFETDYNYINIDEIKNQKKTRAGWSFEDDNNFYNFNYSKSTLYRKFIIPDNAYRMPVEILEDPYELLLSIIEHDEYSIANENLTRGQNYIVLPLYSTKYKEKKIGKKSGLNQWNAGGRDRNIGEVYIPIPIEIHQNFPNFFPDRGTQFNLRVPTGEKLNAKVCQENSKALMTNPNRELSDWLLRKVLKLEEGELATMEKLDSLGFDSVLIVKDDEGDYRIDIMKTGSYTNFWNK